MQEIIKRIYDYSLEEIMGERFGRYAKAIIQDRALPDVRDGLKPVQRRILYAMYRDHNTYDKAYKKSAKTVGNVMGQYHPHGDSSIYEAMVRMSQWWKSNTPYIDMHGNNGSMDGDSPAAMRYTEARLSKISNELLTDIDKETVQWAPNYDDTLLEPIVLPAKFPNLLVNGANGISAGYATNIPPHNLGEVIDATIKRIDSPNCRLDTILDIVKGPDFPTGGIVENKTDIKNALETGKGRITIKSRYKIENKKGKKQIIINEIPFDVNKALLVKKMDEIRINKKIEGLVEVRDETDRDGLQITIDLKKEANEDLILNYMLKNTDLMISYSYNMVAIVNRRPMTLGIIAIIDAYIEYLKDIIIKRTKFDLKTAQARLHIVEGLIKALSILDQVIHTIRKSSNKSNAIDNLIKEYQFTRLQADAIVTLQLYKLTNTDVTSLQEECTKLEKEISIWEQVIKNDSALKHVMKTELTMIKKQYATLRKTEITDTVTEIKIDTTSLIPKEECIVVATKDGYIKRVSLRSYGASNDKTGLKDSDYVISIYQANTMDTILLFTDLGNYLFIPIYEIPDLKWKDLGKHVSNIVKISSDEHLISGFVTKDFKNNSFISFTKQGMVKRTNIEDLKVQRYTKPINIMKLKNNDKVVSVELSKKEVFITTEKGYGLRYNTKEVGITGLKTAGVKAINLKDDKVISAHSFDCANYLALLTDKGTGKRIKMDDFEIISRARKGVLVIRDVKTNPYKIINSFVIDKKEILGIKTNEINTMKITELPICDRYQTGSIISKDKILDSFIVADIVAEEETDNPPVEPQLNNVDERMMTIDDFLGDFTVEE